MAEAAIVVKSKTIAENLLTSGAKAATDVSSSLQNKKHQLQQDAKATDGGVLVKNPSLEKLQQDATELVLEAASYSAMSFAAWLMLAKKALTDEDARKAFFQSRGTYALDLLQYGIRLNKNPRKWRGKLTREPIYALAIYLVQTSSFFKSLAEKEAEKKQAPLYEPDSARTKAVAWQLGVRSLISILLLGKNTKLSKKRLVLILLVDLVTTFARRSITDKTAEDVNKAPKVSLFDKATQSPFN